jgi:hypothetical protein
MECENDIIAKLERRESLKRDEFLGLLERVRQKYLKYEYYFPIQRLCLFPYKSWAVTNLILFILTGYRCSGDWT